MQKITEIIVEPTKITVGSTFKLKIKAIRYMTCKEMKQIACSKVKKFICEEVASN